MAAPKDDGVPTKGKEKTKVVEKEIKKTKEEKTIEKVEKQIAKDVEKIEEKVEEGKISQEGANTEIQKDVKAKAGKAKEVGAKDLAVANAYSLKISPKHSKYICRMIKDKTPDRAIAMLMEVIEGKRAVHMAGLEVAHQKGKGIAGAKFPKAACLEIVEIVRQVKANAVINQVENPVIVIAKSDRASRPYRRAGQRGKRTHIHIEVRDRTKLKVKKK